MSARRSSAGRRLALERRDRRYGLVAKAVVLVLLGVVACGGDDEAADPPPSDRREQSSTLPLLGRRGDAPARPALAVKLDNTARGRPQTGLALADVVFEELVEGGLTRLLAVYHANVPDTVGPVRSARSTDLALLPELGRPVFAWSGANSTFAAAVRRADVIDAGYAAAPGAYRRSDDRPAPYDLYATPADLWAEAPADAPAPPALFRYGTAQDRRTRPETQQASTYRTAPSASLATSITWSWDPTSHAWLRSQDGTPHLTARGTRIAAANVIVRTTRYRDSGVRDSRGAVVPEALAVGRGDAWLLTGGQAVPARWHKPETTAPTRYTDLDGEPLALTPGPTWVEVLPPGAGTIS